MAPYEIRDMTLKELRETRKAMVSWEYYKALKKLSPEKQQESKILLADIVYAIEEMRTAELQNIREKLLLNEPELVAGSESLDKALQNLKKIESVIAAATNFLSVVGRVIKLVG